MASFHSGLILSVQTHFIIHCFEMPANFLLNLAFQSSPHSIPLWLSFKDQTTTKQHQWWRNSVFIVGAGGIK